MDLLFFRFASMEEATKVACMTNGMHVYSWPISCKLAKIGWKDRKGGGVVDRPRWNDAFEFWKLKP